MANYDTDFVAWTREQARALREGSDNMIDHDHLAEEIEDSGKSQEGAVESRLTLVLHHLLKW